MSIEALLAVQEQGGAGCLTYWSLSGGLDPLDLAVTWAEAGLPAERLPELPAPTTALRRAVNHVATGRRVLVRPLEEKGSHAIVLERSTKVEKEGEVDAEAATPEIKQSLAHEVVARVKLDVANRVVLDPPTSPYGPEIRASFERTSGECSASEIGGWLVDEVAALDGVALRETGGFYYLPPGSVAEWARISEAVKRVSGHRIFTIPALRSKDAVEAVLAAIEAEATAEASKLSDEIDAHLSGEAALGERALATRSERCEKVSKKLARYEELLGAHSEKLRERLDAIAEQLALASMAATPVEPLPETGT